MEQLQGFNSMHGTEEELIETIDELAVIHIKTVSDHYKMQIGYLQDHDGVTQEQLERWRDPGNVPQVLESRNPMLIALLKSYLTVSRRRQWGTKRTYGLCYRRACSFRVTH